MSVVEYLGGRRKYQRPQAMLWANNPGTVQQFGSQSYHVPLGLELGSKDSEGTENYFIVTSDDNRSAIDFQTQRIETRKRTVNGRMRSYHIADKLVISTSWEMLPSRSFSSRPDFDQRIGTAKRPEEVQLNDFSFTTDGGAGGNDILDWYERHTGSFWVYLAYDKYKKFGDDEGAYRNLNKYNQVLEVFFSDFQYSVEKRGGSNYDFWNISLSLEEV